MDFVTILPTHFVLYGSYCVGRIVTQSMSYILHLCDCSVPYCALLEVWELGCESPQMLSKMLGYITMDFHHNLSFEAFEFSYFEFCHILSSNNLKLCHNFIFVVLWALPAFKIYNNLSLKQNILTFWVLFFVLLFSHNSCFDMIWVLSIFKFGYQLWLQQLNLVIISFLEHLAFSQKISFVTKIVSLQFV